ncbi:MAG: DUF3794 domain-containing protein [Angelakisella sp.]
MELKLKKQALFISEMLIDTTVEQPVECDALLPDYCPDIVRILKCIVTPTVSGRRLNGQRLELEGMAVIVVYYTSTAEGIHKAEYKVPFAKTLELKAEPAKCAISVHAKAGYINCRAVNQRRLDIRGAVSISASVMGCREEQVVVGGEGAGIQLREEGCNGSHLIGQQSRDVHLSETLELAYGKPVIKDIVRCHGIPRLVECKTSDGKVVIKGELAVHMLYQHASGCDQMDFTLPTAAVVELEGVDDKCNISVCQELMFLSLEPCADREGEYRNITLEAGLLMTVKAECSYKAVTCTDCYSTKGQCSFRTKNYTTLRMEDSFHEQTTLREVMPLPENLEAILDLWCDISSATFRGDQTGVQADGRIVVSMLARMKDGNIYYFDKNMDMDEHLPVAAQNPIVDGRMTVVGSGFNFTANDAIEVRCDIMMDGTAYSQKRCTGVDEVTVDDKKPRTDTVQPGLYLYMAGDNEAVWDIAKRYNTSVARILEENPQGDGKNGDILMIPVL